MINPRPNLPALTSLRFFAAIIVIISHISQPIRWPSAIQGWSSAGYPAVTFFFVLSGFVLTYTYAVNDEGKMKVSAVEFWLARFRRIAPVYYLSLIIAAPPFVYGAFIAGSVKLSVFWPALVLVPTFLQSLFPPTATAWTMPAWSLSVEMVFYAIFPLLIKLCSQVRPVTGYLLALVFVAFVSLLRLRYFPGLDKFALFFPAFHFPQFILGIALCRLWLFAPRLSTRHQTLLFCISTSIVAALLAVAPPTVAQADLYIAPLFAAIIYGAAGPSERLAGVMSGSWLVGLGHASYAMYILHMPIFFWWNWSVRESGLDRQTDLNLASYVLLVIGVSVAIFRFFECPVRHWSRRLHVLS